MQNEAVSIETAEQLRRQQRAVAELGLLAIRERSLERLLQEAATLVRDAVRVDFSKILEVEAGGDLVVRAGIGWPPGVVGVLEVAAEGDSQASYAIRTRQPVVVSDLINETRFRSDPFFLELGVRSGVNVVIEGRQTPFGVLEVDHGEVRTYSQDEIDFLQAAANVLSHAIQRQQSDLDREHLLNIASHELRNPLTVVVAFAERLHRQLSSGEAITLESIAELETLREGAQRLQQLVSMLFQLGEVEQRAWDFEPEPLPLGSLLRATVQQVRQLHPEVEFVEEYEAAPVVMAHEGWARVVLQNIVDNAAKYSRLAPRVTVRLDEVQGQARVRVRDRCGGLDGADLDALFERYFRGHTTEGVRGLGLGLYLARRFSSVLGWQIDVKNFPGEGCEFQVLAGPVEDLAAEPL